VIPCHELTAWLNAVGFGGVTLIINGRFGRGSLSDGCLLGLGFGL